MSLILRRTLKPTAPKKQATLFNLIEGFEKKYAALAVDYHFSHEVTFQYRKPSAVDEQMQTFDGYLLTATQLMWNTVCLTYGIDNKTGRKKTK